MEFYDVGIIGGGLSGLAAAVTAARSGAKTLLLERSDILGGNATLANVHTICGLYDFPSESGGLRYLSEGFSKEFAERLLAAFAALPAEIHGKVGVLPTFPPKMAQVALELCQATENLNLQLGAGLVAAEMDAEGLRPAILKFDTAEGSHRVAARYVIDASGDANAGLLAGASLDVPAADELQTCTYIFRVSGAKPEDLKGYSRLRLTASVVRAAATGQLPASCDSILVRPGQNSGEAYISVNLPKPEEVLFDPAEADFIEVYQEQAKAMALQLIAYLSLGLPGWEGCKLLEFPRRVGIRETRRILGLYRMTDEDVLSGRRFEDEVAQSCWPMELWHNHRGASFIYPEEPCGIPLRALISKDIANLGCVGRCMSATHNAMGSLRVLGTGMATGEAIALAAISALKSGVSLHQLALQGIS